MGCCCPKQSEQPPQLPNHNSQSANAASKPLKMLKVLPKKNLSSLKSSQQQQKQRRSGKSSVKRVAKKSVTSKRIASIKKKPRSASVRPSGEQPTDNDNVDVGEQPNGDGIATNANQRRSIKLRTKGGIKSNVKGAKAKQITMMSNNNKMMKTSTKSRVTQKNKQPKLRPKASIKVSLRKTRVSSRGGKVSSSTVKTKAANSISKSILSKVTIPKQPLPNNSNTYNTDAFDAADLTGTTVTNLTDARGESVDVVALKKTIPSPSPRAATKPTGPYDNYPSESISETFDAKSFSKCNGTNENE